MSWGTGVVLLGGELDANTKQVLDEHGLRVRFHLRGGDPLPPLPACKAIIAYKDQLERKDYQRAHSCAQGWRIPFIRVDGQSGKSNLREMVGIAFPLLKPAAAVVVQPPPPPPAPELPPPPVPVVASPPPQTVPAPEARVSDADLDAAMELVQDLLVKSGRYKRVELALDRDGSGTITYDRY